MGARTPLLSSPRRGLQRDVLHAWRDARDQFVMNCCQEVQRIGKTRLMHELNLRTTQQGSYVAYALWYTAATHCMCVSSQLELDALAELLMLQENFEIACCMYESCTFCLSQQHFACNSLLSSAGMHEAEARPRLRVSYDSCYCAAHPFSADVCLPSRCHGSALRRFSPEHDEYSDAALMYLDSFRCRRAMACHVCCLTAWPTCVGAPAALVAHSCILWDSSRRK